MTESDVIIWALLGGGIGGLASFMWVAYNRFEKIPTREDAEEARKSLRKTYLVLRVAFGIVVAFIFSFWFMDSLISGDLSRNKFVFLSALIGFSTGFLPAVASAFQRASTKIMSKIEG